MVIKVTYLLYADDRIVTVSPSLETLKELARSHMWDARQLAIRAPDGPVFTFDYAACEWIERTSSGVERMADHAEESAALAN